MKDPESNLPEQLQYLQLSYFKEHYQTLADQAALEQLPLVQYLSRLVEGEAALRRDRATQRRVQAARIPVIKSLEEFQWTWPKKINRVQVQQLFRLHFIAEKKNLVLLGGVGLGKSRKRLPNKPITQALSLERRENPVKPLRMSGRLRVCEFRRAGRTPAYGADGLPAFRLEIERTLQPVAVAEDTVPTQADGVCALRAQPKGGQWIGRTHVVHPENEAAVVADDE